MKNQKEKVWKEYFQNKQSGEDCFGTTIYKSKYGEGWVIDHIFPKEKKGLKCISKFTTTS